MSWAEPHQNFLIARSTVLTKIAIAAAVTDPLNPIAAIGVGTDLGDALGIKVAKGADGRPTLLLGIDWATLDDAFWANLLWAANGLPTGYVDSAGNRIQFGALTDNGIVATFVDSQGNPIAGPLTLDLDGNRLLPLQALADQLLTVAPSSIANTRAFQRAAARGPLSLDPQLLDLLWAGGVAGEPYSARCRPARRVPAWTPMRPKGVPPPAPRLRQLVRCRQWYAPRSNRRSSSLKT
ncbi:MAG: hypothetical protein R3F37_02365 [Candidatus Competibacteraceae bacterium]